MERYHLFKCNEKGLWVEFTGWYNNVEFALQAKESAEQAFPEHTFVVMKQIGEEYDPRTI